MSKGLGNNSVQENEGKRQSGTDDLILHILYLEFCAGGMNLEVARCSLKAQLVS